MQTANPIETPPSPARARTAIEGRGLWYHTLEVAPGVETPGWFDLRPIVERMPWPEVRGKRCLEVGPWDGFLSFELERRGAAEVVAADISHPSEWDWPVMITGPWQVLGSARLPVREMVQLDYRYVADWSLWNDIRILLLTVGHVVTRGGT